MDGDSRGILSPVDTAVRTPYWVRATPCYGAVGPTHTRIT